MVVVRSAVIDDTALENEIGRLLAVLYAKRIAKVGDLKLGRLIDKNPYLYRAIGIDDPSQLIEQLLAAFISSSDETIFGNEFFEPLAFWCAKASQQEGVNARSVTVGAGAGQDIAIETATAYFAISVKSGKNIFNAQSAKGQNSEFDALEARLKKLNKQFHRVIGYGYGRKQVQKASTVEKLAGQSFWQMLTGEADFYLRISMQLVRFRRRMEPSIKRHLKQNVTRFCACS
jgi:Type II restriction endonuclease EcoO109I